jgi:DNA-binding protein Fis
MNLKEMDTSPMTQTLEDRCITGKAQTLLESNIGQSIDMLVEYLVDNDIMNIHRLIMGEVEKRVLVKVLERSRGNKRQAAKQLGISRNTFQRKLSKLACSGNDSEIPSAP